MTEKQSQKQTATQQIQLEKYIKEKEESINMFFNQMGLKKEDFSLVQQENKAQKNKENEANNNQNSKQNQYGSKDHKQKLLKEIKEYKNQQLQNMPHNSRGEVVMSIQKLRQNYFNTYAPFRWYSLPFCKRVIIKKLEFWVGACIFLSFVLQTYRMRKNKLSNISFKSYGKTYLLMLGATWTYSFFQSLFFQPYCNINSYHYKKDMSNILLARDLKKQFKSLK